MRVGTILLLYNRPTHTAAVLDSLIENGVRRVRAFMDGSEDPGVLAQQARVLEVIASRPGIEVDLHRHGAHLGLAASVRFALDATMRTEDAAIVVEDDCVVRPGGIRFFLEGLEALRRDARVRSLCAYLPPVVADGPEDTPLLLERFLPWGWATWRDRWASREPDAATALETLAKRGIRLRDLAGDLDALCAAPSAGSTEGDTWTLPWILEHYNTNTFAVYPPRSLVDNIGFDGSGLHCAPSDAFVTPGGRPPASWNWTNLRLSERDQARVRRFMDEHGLKTYLVS